MPLRMCLAHPIGFAALALVAIGFISYQIFSKKQKNKARTSPRSRASSNYPQDYLDIYPSDNYPLRPDSPDSYTGKPKFYSGHTGARKRNTNDGKSKYDNESSKSANYEVICENKENALIKTSDSACGSTRKPESVNDLNSLCETKEDSNKIRNDKKNINQRNAVSLDFDDGASVSSESNTSSVSIETNVTKCECIRDQDQENESICMESQKIRKEVAPLHDTEDFYKLEVYNHLENDYEDEDNLFSDVDSVSSFNSISLEGSRKNSFVCKGCEEKVANAVNYPCGHCYMCLDCAIKVHRIYKKCNVCNLRIKSFN